MKKAFITGITGQDGSYLAELLLSKGYEVHGLIRRASTFNTYRLDQIYHDPHNGDSIPFQLHYGDVTDAVSLTNLLHSLRPDEIYLYHMAAQSHVRVSFDVPVYTGDVTALGTKRLERTRASHISTYRPLNLYASYGSSCSSGKCKWINQPEYIVRNPICMSKGRRAGKPMVFMKKVRCRQLWNSETI